MYDKCCKNFILVLEIILFVFPVLFKIASFIDFQAGTLGRKPRKTWSQYLLESEIKRTFKIPK